MTNPLLDYLTTFNQVYICGKWRSWPVSSNYAGILPGETE